MPFSEAERRIEKARRFLTVAQSDIANGYWDTAIARAYYASFHSAVAYMMCRQIRPAPKGRWEHAYVQERFLEQTQLAAEEAIGRKLRRLYAARIVADYSPREMDRSTSIVSVDMGHEIVEFCANEVASVIRGEAK